MKDAEDEAFDELAKRQGHWGGGFMAKKAMAMDKMQEPAQEPVHSVQSNGRHSPLLTHMMNKRTVSAQPAQEPTSGDYALGYAEGFNDACKKPAQEPYDQTALELCNVCGWKTLIPDDCCLNCERAQPAQEPVSFPCCGYTDANAIRWNQFNGVVQCHMCGQVYTVAQPAQEPVARVSGTYGGRFVYDPINPAMVLPVGMALYSSPQHTATWVGLTDEEIKEIIGTWGDTPIKGYTRKLFDQIEAKLRSKNNG